tara:strand:+ start:13 stop:660 length:648 start_codon:yes stop_codon:yes gene_type:complete
MSASSTEIKISNGNGGGGAINGVMLVGGIIVFFGVILLIIRLVNPDIFSGAKEGDKCSPKDKDIRGNYEIDSDKKCVLKSCISGWESTGTECVKTVAPKTLTPAEKEKIIEENKKTIEKSQMVYDHTFGNPSATGQDRVDAASSIIKLESENAVLESATESEAEDAQKILDIVDEMITNDCKPCEKLMQCPSNQCFACYAENLEKGCPTHTFDSI